MNNITNKDIVKRVIALDRETNQIFEFSSDGEGIFFSGDKKYDVRLENTFDGFTFLTVNDKTYPVDIVSKNQNIYELLVNGVGYTFSVETPFSIERKKILDSQAGESSTLLLKAPMPGKIIEVLVKTGDSVKAGDTLLVLEAMKMQNAILASSKAMVKKVVVKAGDTTSKSDLLIELEKL